MYLHIKILSVLILNYFSLLQRFIYVHLSLINKYSQTYLTEKHLFDVTFIIIFTYTKIQNI